MTVRDQDRFKIFVTPEGVALNPDGTPNRDAELTDELLLVDGALREVHLDAAVFTQFPIGRGGVVSDHIQNAPALLDVDLIVTDTPTSTPSTANPDNVQIVETSSGTSGLQTSGPTAYLERGKAVYDRLLRLKTAASLLRVVTTKRVYRNMVITSLEVPVESDARTTELRVTFQQLLFADSQETLIEVVAQPNQRKKVDRGNQETEEVTEENAKPKQSRGLLTAFLESI